MKKLVKSLRLYFLIVIAFLSVMWIFQKSFKASAEHAAYSSLATSPSGTSILF